MRAAARVSGLAAAVVVLAALACACTTPDIETPANCNTYIVVPPHHTDEKASDLIASIWIKAAKAKLRRCDRMIPFAEGKAAFLLLGINHDETVRRDRFGDDQIDHLIKKTHASHLVVLHYKVIDTQLSVRPRILHLRPWQKLQDLAVSAPVETQLPADSPLKPTSGFKVALAALRIIPNALVVGSASSVFNNNLVATQGNGSLVQIGQKENSWAPPFLSSISLTNLDHPYGMQLWDFGWEWFGSLALVDVDSTFTYSSLPVAGAAPGPDGGPPPSVTFTYSLSLFMVVPTINGGFFVHTPIGTTALSLGTGPGFYTYHDSLGDGGTGVSLVIRFELSHTVFVTEKWFLQFSLTKLTPQSFIVDNADFRAGGSTYGILGVGYFFPEVRTLTRQLF